MGNKNDKMTDVKEKKERILTVSGVLKEMRRVRWAPFIGNKKENGVLRNTAEVIAFTGFWALILLGGDAVAAVVLQTFGI